VSSSPGCSSTITLRTYDASSARIRDQPVATASTAETLNFRCPVDLCKKGGERIFASYPVAFLLDQVKPFAIVDRLVCFPAQSQYFKRDFLKSLSSQALRKIIDAQLTR